jgi:hypothetical protein
VSILEQVKQRLDEVFNELQEKEDIIRNSDLHHTDPDKFVEVDFEATRLDGRLEELMWIRELLQR